MDFDQAILELAQANLRDEATGQTAPIEIWGAMLHLAGPNPDIEQSIAQQLIQDRATKWRAAWLTADRVIYAEGLRSVERWNAHTDRAFDPLATTQKVEAWTRRRAEITGVSLTDESPSSRGTFPLAWRYRCVATFGDGVVLTLPLFAAPQQGFVDWERVERFSAGMAERL